MVRSGYDFGATGSFSCLTGVDDSSSWPSCSSSSACCSGLHVRYGLTHPHTVQTRLASPIAARTNICARPPNLQVRMRCSGADAAAEDSDGQASGADAAKAGGSKPAAAKPAAAKPAAPTPPEPAAAKPAAAKPAAAKPAAAKPAAAKPPTPARVSAPVSTGPAAAPGSWAAMAAVKAPPPMVEPVVPEEAYEPETEGDPEWDSPDFTEPVPEPLEPVVPPSPEVPTADVTLSHTLPGSLSPAATGPDTARNQLATQGVMNLLSMGSPSAASIDDDDGRNHSSLVKESIADQAEFFLRKFNRHDDVDRAAVMTLKAEFEKFDTFGKRELDDTQAMRMLEARGQPHSL